MADLDDFFAKKDRKKAKGKKFTTADEIAKKLEETGKKIEKSKKEKAAISSQMSGQGEEEQGNQAQVSISVRLKLLFIRNCTRFLWRPYCRHQESYLPQNLSELYLLAIYYLLHYAHTIEAFNQCAKHLFYRIVTNMGYHTLNQ